MLSIQSDPGLATRMMPNDKPLIPYRYKLMFLTSGIFFLAVSMRINFNIAMVAMVNFTSEDQMVNNSEGCPVPANTTSKSQPQGEFSWTPEVQGQLLAAFFYGYIFTQFPGGYLAEIFGAKLVLGMIPLLSGCLTLLIPVVARFNVQMLFGLRILMGVAQGPLYPANIALWSRWAPSFERSQLTAWAGIGASVGMIVSSSLTGYLCSLEFLGGWPLAFYVIGTCSLLWFIIWIIFAYDSPNTHPGLSLYEKKYIQENNSTSSHSQDSKVLRRPWFAIFTSLPVLAINVFSLLDGIGYYILFAGVPIYLKQILKYDMSSLGFLSALPYVGNAITGALVGPLADYLRRNKILSTGATRKLFAFIGEGLLIVFLIGMAFVACNKFAMCLLVLAMTIYGFSIGSQPVNHLDIAPIYAGTLMGISNVFANIGGFVSPAIVSAITQDQPSRTYWQYCFYLAAVIYGCCTLFYITFSSGEEQEWAKGHIDYIAQVDEPENVQPRPRRGSHQWGDGRTVEIHTGHTDLY